ncbi:tRNA (guanosine(46)-N7)-methyltransferase TrmB [Fodinibius sediminis]|uniref:tRNA (guanine-N(7)-)-methyltransferase n=1 Tax=Fodinibius sediminis TaxID=1214077 RepID=A0A521F4W0_9BACT|nr:tRNA (guanosine(46)-N7)-methyltransferase TrmB [Fodinibius sediminis]SMO91203.1 tRNA (guanine-N7-)-methyltransferase [Fodinibius sediminis]
MGRNKLERFDEIGTFDNVSECTDYQDEEAVRPGGKWRSDVFENEHPIILELACGKGEYALALSEHYPDRNIIGVDIKGARIWKGARRALKNNRWNVHFLRIYIDHLDEYFAPGEVDDIWITFPDPYPRGSDRSKRLTSPKFLDIYQKVLGPEGSVRLKTDSEQLFDYTRRTIEKTGCTLLDLVDDIYRERPDDKLLTQKTYFEKKHLEKGRTISYLRFSLPEGKILD